MFVDPGVVQLGFTLPVTNSTVRPPKGFHVMFAGMSQPKWNYLRVGFHHVRTQPLPWIKSGPRKRLPGCCQNLGDSGFLQFLRVVSSNDKANPGIGVPVLEGYLEKLFGNPSPNLLNLMK